MTNTQSKKTIYEKNPEIIAAFLMDNEGKMVFDYDETRVEIHDMMLILQNTVAEYLKVINTMHKSQSVSQSPSVKNNITK